MNVVNAIKERRSIKHYDANYKIPVEDENLIFESALQSPTAFNIQNWRFINVKDPAIRNKIRDAAWDQTQVTDASLLIILCADLNSWQKDPQRYWRNANKDVQDFMLPAIDQYYREKEQVQRDEAMRSCSIAAQTLMLAAKGLGYDSCPMDGFDYQKVGKIINLPHDHIISLMVVIGKGTKEAWPKPGQLAMNEVVIENGW